MSSPSTLNLNEFVSMCDCFVQFANEYPCADPRYASIKEFCEYVRSSKPFSQLGDKMLAFVKAHTTALVSGIVVPDDNDPSPGAIFEEDNATIELVGGGDKVYTMHIGIMYALILDREADRQQNDRRKDPKTVCLYVMSVFSRCLRCASLMAFGGSKEGNKIYSSIDYNTFKPKDFEMLKSPYSPMSFEKLRAMGARYIKKRSATVDEYAGEGRANQIAAVIEKADMSSIVSGTTMSTIAAAINSEDESAVESALMGIYVSATNSVHNATEQSNSISVTDQL